MLLAVRPAVLVAAIAAASFVCPRAFADEGAGEKPAAPAQAADPALQPIRDSFAAMMDAAKAGQEAGNDQAKRKAAGDAMRKAREEFTKLFAGSDWNSFDPVADMQLLQNGLSVSGFNALNSGDSKTAVRAFEMYVAKFPDNAAVYHQYLSMAHIAAGDLEKGRADLDTAVAKGDDKTRPGAQVQLGDLLAAQGDMAGAQKLWQAVIDGVPADVDPRRDPRGGARSDAEMRTSLIGKPAPEIDSKTWLDGEAKALSAMKGSVVIVDFWATWCPPCRAVMPGLDKLAQEKKKDGLVVLGVTRLFGNGFLPNAGTKDPLRDGEQVKSIKPEEYEDHLRKFKANVGITYPFVVATEAEPKAYHVTGIPTMAVIDREGKVAFLKVGSGDETLLRLVVDRLLAPAK